MFWDSHYNIEVSRIDPKDMSLDKVLVQNWLNYARDHSLFGFKFENGWDAPEEVLKFNDNHETKFTFFGLDEDGEEQNFEDCKGCTYCGHCDFCETCEDYESPYGDFSNFLCDGNTLEVYTLEYLTKKKLYSEILMHTLNEILIF